MKAIILSAGRGSRLLPLTETRPKCLLPVGNTTVLGRQLDTLEAGGVTEAVIVTGFMAALVEEEATKRTGPMKVTTLYNPFYQIADNLASCWMVREHMDSDFLLINGDTLFEQALLDAVISSPHNLPVQVTIDHKADYDSDDMKVQLDGSTLLAIGKALPLDETDAESIGMLRFTGAGPKIYRDKLEQMMRTPEGVSNWFLKAIDAIANTTQQVGTFAIDGHRWNEVDTVEDYHGIDAHFRQS
jgi:choline kinase